MTAPHDRVETTSVSVDVVETDPIVLRETPTRRLVFLPTIVDRDPPLRGYFVYQRRAAGQDREDVRGENFNALKSGEGWVLELHSDEVARPATLQPEAVTALGRNVDLSQLDALLDAWLANADNDDEDFWPELLAEHARVFSQLTGSPVVVLQESVGRG